MRKFESPDLITDKGSPQTLKQLVEPFFEENLPKFEPSVINKTVNKIAPKEKQFQLTVIPFD
jgi:hypothetical protein